MKRVLLIDNYDSFTYNLAQVLGEFGCDVLVRRNDAVTPEEADRLEPRFLVVSPGPGHPRDSRASLDLIRHYVGKIPVLGVCLGHQAIGMIYGGEIALAPRMMHGKVSKIYHDGQGLYRGLPNPFEATRYHSLIVREENLPKSLLIAAHTSEGEIMGLRHRDFDVEGVQFHPESVMTREGKTLLG
ncbi:MAG: aminodeoxychorismate/anthranilate synthase component II, partial [Planctomycetes bacterium]|nr:aminodeoxychorismate/anthranilate synthase component II [Planctomycetota bacterium]